MNHCTFIGNITRDIDLKYLPKGTAVAEFGLALNHKWKDDQGVKHEDVSFIDVSAFGRTAEVLGEYCKKGDKIALECRAKQESWEDKQSGQKRSKIKFIVESMELLGQKRSEDTAGQPERPPQRPAQRSAPPKGRPAPKDPDLDPPESDIPF